MRRLAAALCLALTAPAAALAPPPDDEDALFGTEPAPTGDREALLRSQDDHLQIGGLLYLRSVAVLTDSDRLADQRLSFPNILETYLDARPSDRLRAFVKGRLTWNPSLSGTEPPTPAIGVAGASTSASVDTLLDELWLKFDVARTVFVTVGQQPVRWGTSRLWNPVDMINATRRPLLALYDDRTGVPLVKLHVPIESLGWNFYLLGFTEAVDSFEDAGGAARAEFAFWTVEVALSGAWRAGADPRVGLDLSAGIWDLDVTSEVSATLRRDADWSPSWLATAGVEYGLRLGDEDVLYLGAEFLFNPDGTADTVAALPGLLAGTVQPFYIGRYYAAGYASLPAPGRWDDTTFLVSAISNLSDRSAIVRLDVSQRVLTYLTVQLFVSAHVGEPGELRPGPDLNPAIPYTVLGQAGAYLRLDI